MSNKIFLADGELIAPNDFRRKAEALSSSSNEGLVKTGEGILDRKINTLINYADFETFCLEEKIMDEELFLLKIRQGRVAVNKNNSNSINNLKNSMASSGWVFFRTRSYFQRLDSLDDNTKSLNIEEFTKTQVSSEVFRDILLAKNIQNIPKERNRIVRRFMYFYKYVFLKNFFFENSNRFMPDYDFSMFEGSDKRKLFLNSVMKEFDKLAESIDKLAVVQDINETPDYLLEYLSQLVGYERDSGNARLSNVYFRELVKSIVDIYKIKGTIFAYELFFNFVGFEIDIQEYWFDRRFFKSSIVNPFTEAVPRFKEDPLRYLTPIRPTLYYFDEVGEENKDGKFIYENPGEEDLIKSNSLYSFSLLLENDSELLENYGTRDERIEALLYGNLRDEKKRYTFFKTNFVSYTIRRNESLSDAAFTQEDNAAVQVFINFLTPIFINRSLRFIPRPFENFFGWILQDFNKSGTVPLSYGFGEKKVALFGKKISTKLGMKKGPNEEEGDYGFLYNMKRNFILKDIEKNIISDIDFTLSNFFGIQNISRSIRDSLEEFREKIFRDLKIDIISEKFNIDQETKVAKEIINFSKDVISLLSERKDKKVLYYNILENGINLYGNDVEKIKIYVKDKLFRSLEKDLRDKLEHLLVDASLTKDTRKMQEVLMSLKKDSEIYLNKVFYFIDELTKAEDNVYLKISPKDYLDRVYGVEGNYYYSNFIIMNKEYMSEMIKENTIDNMKYEQFSIQDFIDYTEGPFINGELNEAGEGVFSEKTDGHYYNKTSIINDTLVVKKKRVG